MIRNPSKLREFEDEQLRREPIDVRRNIEIMNALLTEAHRLGVFPPKDPFEGFEEKLKTIRVLNALRPRS